MQGARWGVLGAGSRVWGGFGWVWVPRAGCGSASCQLPLVAEARPRPSRSAPPGDGPNRGSGTGQGRGGGGRTLSLGAAAGVGDGHLPPPTAAAGQGFPPPPPPARGCTHLGSPPPPACDECVPAHRAPFRGAHPIPKCPWARWAPLPCVHPTALRAPRCPLRFAYPHLPREQRALLRQQLSGSRRLANRVQGSKPPCPPKAMPPLPAPTGQPAAPSPRR